MKTTCEMVNELEAQVEAFARERCRVLSCFIP